MNKYRVKNGFVSFNLRIPDNIELAKIESFLFPYLLFEENETSNNITIELYDDLNRFLNYNTDNLKDIKHSFILDSHLAIFRDNTLSIYIDQDHLNKEYIFIKRLLSDTVNRLMEQIDTVFLHSSSIIDNGETIVFIGEKGAGKTTNMLYSLLDSTLSYSSNERTGIIRTSGGILTYGNPSKINIRIHSIKNNENLKNKIFKYINQDIYFQYENFDLPRDCVERVDITYNNLIYAMKSKAAPIGKLKAICNLNYDANTAFEMERVDYLSIKNAIDCNRIDGVYNERAFLQELMPASSTNLDCIFDDNSIAFYNIYQDNKSNNTKKLIKRIRSD